MADRTVTLRDRDRDDEHRVRVADDGGVTVDGHTTIAVARTADGALRVGHEPARTAWTAAAGDTTWVFLEGEVYRFEVAREGPRSRPRAHQGSLAAPMPATVARVHVAPGDAVSRGQTLIVLEAMKMELPVLAPSDGIITAVLCREGQMVQPGVSLIEMDERTSS